MGRRDGCGMMDVARLQRAVVWYPSMIPGDTPRAGTYLPVGEEDREPEDNKADSSDRESAPLFPVR